MKALQKTVSETESAVAKAEARLAAIDAALAGQGTETGKPAADLAGLSMAELGKRRREVAEALAAAEAKWIAAGEALEAFMA